MSCGVDLLLCLWCKLAAVALIQLLAWESPYGTDAALKSKKKKKKKKKKWSQTTFLIKKKIFNSHTCNIWKFLG